MCLSIFPSDVWDKLWVLIRSVPEVSLLIQGEVGVIQHRRAAVSASALNVPFEKNKMASTLTASVITTWSVHIMQGG